MYLTVYILVLIYDAKKIEGNYHVQIVPSGGILPKGILKNRDFSC